MSIKLMSAIFETEMKDLPYRKDGEERNAKASTAKLVLLALADHANDYGESTYPGYDKLEVKTALSRQGLADTLAALKENGLLNIDVRGSRIGTNNYTINIGAFSPMFREVEELMRVKPLDQQESSHLTSKSQVARLESSIKHNKTINKKGNLLDGILFYAEQGKEQGIDEVENILVQLERGLRVNIDRSPKAQQAAKRILRDGRSLDTWLSWCKSDEWRLAHLYLYADVDRVWREFPQAFDNNDGMNPQGLSIE